MPDTCCQNDLMDYIRSELKDILEISNNGEQVERSLVHLIDQIAAFYYVSRYTPEDQCLYHTLCQETWDLLEKSEYVKAMHHQFECDCGHSITVKERDESREHQNS